MSRLFEGGESGFVYPLRYLFIPAADVEGCGVERDERVERDGCNVEVLFTVPKRFHKRANKRNLLRRRVKEAYRLQKGLLEGLPSGLNMALIYTSKEILEYDRIYRAVTKILSNVKEQSVNECAKECHNEKEQSCEGSELLRGQNNKGSEQ